ncbi:hypothetical protein BASA50_005724 [Batrachochytrium salamandrivorans]|uniref:PUM-HD domain-containing protein n=1 Tax=Batrachochytrium salamandrivorans TaxID=1357716 RepID=A0ABQ8FBT2_9FUNG|nr:hypothetical protein BASA50_005724 [Batrachochytrium salamandrivorans]
MVSATARASSSLQALVTSNNLCNDLSGVTCSSPVTAGTPTNPTTTTTSTTANPTPGLLLPIGRRHTLHSSLMTGLSPIAAPGISRPILSGSKTIVSSVLVDSHLVSIPSAPAATAPLVIPSTMASATSETPTASSLGALDTRLSLSPPPIRRSRAETFSAYSFRTPSVMDSPFSPSTPAGSHSLVLPPVLPSALTFGGSSPKANGILGLTSSRASANLDHLHKLQQLEQRLLPHQRRGRHRTGSLSIPLHGISDAFETALFSSTWEPSLAVPSSINESVSSQPHRSADVMDDFEGSTALVRTLDYLGLDDVSEQERDAAANTTNNTIGTTIGTATGTTTPPAAGVTTKVGQGVDSGSSLGQSIALSLASQRQQQTSHASIPQSPITTSRQPSIQSQAEVEKLFWDSSFPSVASMSSMSSAPPHQRGRSVSFMSGQHSSRFLRDLPSMASLTLDQSPYPSQFTPTRPRSSTIAYIESDGDSTPNPFSYGMHPLGTLSTPSISTSDYLCDASSNFDISQSQTRPLYASHTMDSLGTTMRDFSERSSLHLDPCSDPFTSPQGDVFAAQEVNSDDFYQEMHLPSRSLWVGNIDALLSSTDLHAIFAPFGFIESIRMLPEKECAFINFVSMEDAVHARQKMHGGRIRNNIVRVGFGKSDSGTEVHGTQPTKSIWIGNISPTTNPADLESIFSRFGQVESARVLTHKNCGFVNFVRLQDALRARDDMNNADIGGFVVKIGFAKVPGKTDAIAGISSTNGTGSATIAASSSGILPSMPNSSQSPNSSSPTALRHSLSPLLGSNPTLVTSSPLPSSKNRSPILKPVEESPLQEEQSLIDQMPSTVPDIAYASTIPRLPEANPQHAIDPSRLRDIRKRLDGMMTPRDIDAIYQETIGDAAQLCSDYIGNIVIQKVVEKCLESQRQHLVEMVAPHLPALGVHKNGTWAVQKIIDRAKTHSEITAIVDAIRPFTPPLLLDQFGNYVVQCCLRLGPQYNQFIFDSLYTKCLELGQGRYGARGMRACLESSHTTKDQQKLLQIAVTRHASQLSMNSNGAILLTWLMDVCPFPGRYRALIDTVASRIDILATHKLASVCVLKLVIQQVELDARERTLNEIFYNDTHLDAILTDHAHGAVLLQKILSSACASIEERIRLAECTRKAFARSSFNTEGHPTYRRLMDELAAIDLLQNSPTSTSVEPHNMTLRLSMFSTGMDHSVPALATTPTFQRTAAGFVTTDEQVHLPQSTMGEEVICSEPGDYHNNNGTLALTEEAFPSPQLTPHMPFSSHSPVLGQQQQQQQQQQQYHSMYEPQYDPVQHLSSMYVYPYAYPPQYPSQQQFQQLQQFQQHQRGMQYQPSQELQEHQPSYMDHRYNQPSAAPSGHPPYGSGS